MTTVDENRLKGNYGASIVMSRLSGECLVRPVAVDTDVGVDLYCETVIERQPFLHFWVQVKAGDQCVLDEKTDKISCRFSTNQLAYWARQPVPVFAALVPTSWPAQGDTSVYIVNITNQILFDKILGPKASVALASDYCWPVGDQIAVRSFLTTVVPDTTARLQISKGLVADIPTPEPQYVRTRPLIPVLSFKDRILYQLRTTAATSIISMFESNQGLVDPEFRRLLASVVEQFGDDPHWENFMSRALSSHIDNDYDNAVAMYMKAKKCIEGDPNVRDQDAWKERVNLIESLEEKARRKEEFQGSIGDVHK